MDASSLAEHAAALAKEVLQLTGDLGSAFRKAEYTMVLQQFDMLMAAPAVEEVAAMATQCREEMRVLDAVGQSLNVLGADFLTWRLTTPQGRAIGVEGNYSVPKPPTVSDGAYQVYTLEQRIEEAWGHALLAAMRQMPDEQEHHEEVVSDFERLFERCSDYLRAMQQDTTDAVHLLEVTVMDASELPTQFIVCAALVKHPLTDVASVVNFVGYLRQHNIPLSLTAAEQLERVYLRFMKGKAAVDVFESVTAAGVLPLSARPFAMLFNNLTDASAVLDAYDLMLDYGIAPEASTLRILCKQSRMEYAKLHFTMVLKSMASAEGATQLQSQPQSQSPSPPPPPRSPLTAGAAPTHTTAAAAAASRRRDERSYFAQRIDELAEHKPKASLLEALKVLHRAEVEGTSLHGDTYIMSALLRHYCRGTTPRRYLVLPFNTSLAYRPEPVHDDARPTDEVRLASAKVYAASANAFDFGLDNAKEDLLEGEEETTIHEELEGLPGAASRPRSGAEAEPERGRRPRPPPRDPYLADSSEEGTYILAVLKAYGSYPDNAVLQSLSAQYEGQMPHMEIVASAADAFFEGCEATHGAMCPVDCRFLHALGYYYIDNRWRDRAHQLVRRVLEMFHAYQVVYRADLSGTERWFSYFAVIVGTKTGPLDLGVGLFAASIALSDRTVNPKVATKLTAKRDSSEHVIEVVAELEKCGWDPHRILCCDALMLEPQERASAEGGEGGYGANGGGGGAARDSSSSHHHHTRGSPVPATHENAPGKDSIYTSVGQGPSSFANAHLLSARPSLVTYMYVAMRDLGVERKTSDWLRDKLRAARQEALASHKPR